MGSGSDVCDVHQYLYRKCRADFAPSQIGESDRGVRMFRLDRRRLPSVLTTWPFIAAVEPVVLVTGIVPKAKDRYHAMP